MISMWSQMLFSDHMGLWSFFLNRFHDYTCALLGGLLVFIGVVSASKVSNQHTTDKSLSLAPEIVWTVAPVVMLLLVCIPSLKLLYMMDRTEPFLTVKIMGRQWYWNYALGDMDFDSYMSNSNGYRLLDTDHRLVLPVMVNVRGLVTGGDVIHSWSVPVLAVKADAVPGRLNQLSMFSMNVGVAYGQCSEICGANHSFMPISVEMVSLVHFCDWFSVGVSDEF
uniref:Cytochrome c oxidase subunit 2 n=1 Tax=Flustrellidra hispida TaxID=97271 RepID=Q15K52_9BILA|nr:cytochrome c oxidase subunit II [Flustrellidra hispida]AAZ76754.1 cytochrome c oxidase subunit II [Flustrellidra hispida]